ncbi:NAD dependent epimerase/dehydratase [Colletotrichum higginsianum]|uniref:NAD dependent epimerase/dehydratase n=1 Tax=Colletotrichum higginsianum (strain IMI 349063) TaxID=759273 RepID=H1V7W6_COLHI|nr:NAD dependent epimerase/dehydratase [Colletotrichum higginsianum IMI 349063]OBR06457.1 NAD dependent epimerase/dehydratase [Colletotrichum higginsianum IMI 349063]CCF36318.1 NAD dependent epimerase/dehydratase [Colletotrichum higginsianum]
MSNEILVTGAAGFVGQALISALVKANPSTTLVVTDVIEPPIPADVAGEGSRIHSLKADLTDPAAVSSLLSRQFAAVYLLHGLMSGGAEANLDLGLKVNLDSVRAVLDHLRKSYPGTTVIFTSSCAVYGPRQPVIESETVPKPKTSYGTEKLIVELLVEDYSRRGLIDGRIVRLPTVTVRPGAPSAAASSFASGIVRESLKGVKNILPVSRDLEIWVCSPATVVKNLVKVKDVPKEKFGDSRVVNLPGITVTVQEILDAVEKVGGKEALAQIEEKRDPAVLAIVNTWPARFDVSRAYSLGLEPDGPILEAVEAFSKTLEA